MIKFWEPEGYHQLGRGRLEEVTWEEVYARFKLATGAVCGRSLAGWLGIKRGWFWECNRLQIVPKAWLRKLAEQGCEYSPDWVLTGEGEVFVELPQSLRRIN